MDFFSKKNRYFSDLYKYKMFFDRYFTEWDTGKETKNDLHTTYNRRLLKISGSVTVNPP